MRHRLVHSQGNFGSIAGLPPAAHRYTEARLTAVGAEMLADLEYDTVDYIDSYDGKYREPLVLPSRFPNLLVNGSDGIAVGMATDIPPHNLREVCDALVRRDRQPRHHHPPVDDRRRGDRLQGAARPGLPHRRHHLRPARHLDGYMTGRGKVTLRARADIVEEGRDTMIVIKEIPYQQTRNRVAEAIGNLVKDERIQGIREIRDESSERSGEPVRLVIYLKQERRPASDPQPVVPVFAAGEDRQHHPAGPGGRPAAHAHHQADARGVPPPPPRGHSPADRVSCCARRCGGRTSWRGS